MTIGIDVEGGIAHQVVAKAFGELLGQGLLSHLIQAIVDFGREVASGINFLGAVAIGVIGITSKQPEIVPLAGELTQGIVVGLDHVVVGQGGGHDIAQQVVGVGGGVTGRVGGGEDTVEGIVGMVGFMVSGVDFSDAVAHQVVGVHGGVPQGIGALDEPVE